MNPSANGWIDKFGSLIADHHDVFQDVPTFYKLLKELGFVYGINVGIPNFIPTEHELSEDEKAKINLITALYGTFRLESNGTNFKDFTYSVFKFYKELKIGNSSILNRFLVGKNTSAQLEQLIDSRAFLEENLIGKTFSSFITNSLLFIDVLLYKQYLEDASEIRKQAQRLEYLTINITYHALNSKKRNRSDERLEQLFASSLTFIEVNEKSFDGHYRKQLVGNKSPWENQYFLDIACLTVWEDHSLDYQESQFVFGFGKDLGFGEMAIKKSLIEVQEFFKINSRSVPFLKDHNLAVQFYDSMAKVVNKLILRNSKRLQKELSQSKELVYLLSKSTIKDLTSEEKKKVQNQLLDIFKSIPSLAIFLLPGGAVLLPIFIKLIPKLLPSAFDDNRIEK